MNRHRSLATMLMIMSCLLFVPQLATAKIATRSFGYGLSAVGQAGLTHSSDTMGGLGVSLAYAPFDLAWFEPSLQLEATAGVFDSGFGFGSLRGVLGFDIFRTLSHPFQFLTNNKSMWSMSVGIGVQAEFSRMDTYPTLYLSCSPLKIKDKDYWYEWLSPYMTIDFSQGAAVIDSWGLVLFRFTALVI